MKALIFGEIIWDVYPDKKSIGGAPFNFAAHIAHLGDSAYLMSSVGKDELGKTAISKAENHGIKTEFIKYSDHPTGMCTVTLDENKIPSYKVHTNTAYDNIEITDNDIESIKAVNADVFYFNTLIQRNDVSRNSLIKILKQCDFKQIFCDINIREGCYNADSIKLCMEKSTIVKISDEEAHYLYDTGILEETGKGLFSDIADEFGNMQLIVYTKGEKGSEVYDIGNNVLYTSEKPPKTHVLSTVGAGDCYGATFLSNFLSHGDIMLSMNNATLRSCLVVESYEAVPF